MVDNRIARLPCGSYSLDTNRGVNADGRGWTGRAKANFLGHAYAGGWWIDAGRSAKPYRTSGILCSKAQLGHSEPALVIFLFGYLSVIMSNVMSNTATASLLIPVGIKLMPGHAVGIAVSTALCASFAILLPVSTPPNAIAFSTG